MERETGKLYREDLAVGLGKKVRIQWSHGYSYTSLVCKDGLDSGTQAAIMKLRPSFVFLPAMSPSLDEFEAMGVALSTGQTVTIVSNFSPSTAKPSIGTAIGPLRGQRNVVRSALRGEGATIIDLRTWTWTTI
jgi:hypothetical protein